MFEKYYLFEDFETHERFLVRALKSSKALEIACHYFEDPEFLGKITDEEAEKSGLIEYNEELL